MQITERKHGPILVLGLNGKLDTATADQLEDSLLGRIRGGERQVILDAADLTYISSTGLRVLFLAAQELQEPPGRLSICGLNERLRDIFATTGFLDIFSVHDSLDQAIQAMEKAE
jgi:anti-anti-sigma factor